WKEHMSGQEAPSSAKVIAETSHSKGILMWGLSRPRLLSQSFEQSGRSICRGRRGRPLPRVEGAYVGAGGAVLCQEWKEHMSGQKGPSSAKVIAETSHSKGILMWVCPALACSHSLSSRVEGAYVGAERAVLCQEWKEHMSGQEAPSSAKVIAETSHSKGILMWGLSRPRLLSQSFRAEWKEHMSGQEALSSAKVIAETSHSKGILMWGLSRPRLLSQSFEQSGRSI
ncbi:unnamed protein product, partial [Closterium sp. Naga37s-1]